MTTYAEFFLGSRRSVVQWETLEISHPSFSKTYRLVRNNKDGIDASPSENTSKEAFAYYPLRIRPIETRDNLNFGIQVDLGDLGELLPTELDAIAADGTFSTKPKVVYRTYRSDDLDKPLYGPLVLEVTSFQFSEEGATFEAEAPTINLLRTGEVYSLDRFPMLRAFI